MLARISKPTEWEQSREGDWQQWWLEIKSGKSESLARIFCDSYPQLYNYGYKIVRDEALVKDSIQELFLNLWSKRKEVSEAYSVKSYLFSSLRRVIFRRLKKMRNRQKRDYDYTRDSFSEVYDVEKLIIHFETESQKKQKLMEALLALTQRQKEAVYLKFYNGLSNDEISEVMQVNKQSVYNHISKAIHAMQSYVKA